MYKTYRRLTGTFILHKNKFKRKKIIIKRDSTSTKKSFKHSINWTNDTTLYSLIALTIR